MVEIHEEIYQCVILITEILVKLKVTFILIPLSSTVLFNVIIASYSSRQGLLKIDSLGFFNVLVSFMLDAYSILADPSLGFEISDTSSSFILEVSK